MRRATASQTRDRSEPVSYPSPQEYRRLRMTPALGRVTAFVVTLAFFAVFGIPWFFICRCDPRDWWGDALLMYRQLSRSK